NNADALAGSQLDALLTYNRRSAEVDADIQHILAAAATDADRAAARRLLDQLAAYRQVAWQAIAIERQSPVSDPGVPPPAARGYYAQATNILHFELLPTAKLLRESSQAALERSYADETRTAVQGIVLTLGTGVALVLLLVFVQRRLVVRY